MRSQSPPSSPPPAARHAVLRMLQAVLKEHLAAGGSACAPAPAAAAAAAAVVGRCHRSPGQAGRQIVAGILCLLVHGVRWLLQTQAAACGVLLPVRWCIIHYTNKPLNLPERWLLQTQPAACDVLLPVQWCIIHYTSKPLNLPERWRLQTQAAACVGCCSCASENEILRIGGCKQELLSSANCLCGNFALDRLIVEVPVIHCLFEWRPRCPLLSKTHMQRAVVLRN